ncbi:fluoride efflux transporter CrcB [Amaricoccus sp.]|uniref:fluoride efflux transporter CrcB n=1 Tax=Amaricoccus sp. TaxID=1872485 RepID=UPI0026056337|nr:fluoride efflux transporter CrcB [uncultured Amaricoccus sp.]
MPVLLQIALGGAIGASARYLLVNAVTRFVGPGFPWGTFLVNVVGCFGIGLAAALLLGSSDPALRRVAPFVVPGVLGGFTTFSAFSLETFQLIDRGALAAAAAYVGGSVGIGLAALVAGLGLARWITP